MSAPAQTPIVRRIPLGRLRAHARNPRLDLGDVSELAASLKTGQLQPIHVQPLGGGYFEIIDGHRRFGAATAAGLSALNAIVVAPRSDAQVVTTMLNAGVHSLPLSPVERQRAVCFLMAEQSMTAAQIAEECGVAVGTVYRWRSRTESSAPRREPGAPSGPRPAAAERKRPPTVVRVKRVAQVADRWLPRVTDDGLSAAEALELLGELRELTGQTSEVPS